MSEAIKPSSVIFWEFKDSWSGIGGELRYFAMIALVLGRGSEFGFHNAGFPRYALSVCVSLREDQMEFQKVTTVYSSLGLINKPKLTSNKQNPLVIHFFMPIFKIRTGQSSP